MEDFEKECTDCAVQGYEAPTAKEYLEEVEKQAPSFKTDVEDVAEETINMLIKKNESYGNSALDPIRVFSRADNVEQLKVRIDDKLSRLQRGNAFGEDNVNDLIGYLFLLKIALKKYSAEK